MDAFCLWIGRGVAIALSGMLLLLLFNELRNFAWQAFRETMFFGKALRIAWRLGRRANRKRKRNSSA